LLLLLGVALFHLLRLLLMLSLHLLFSRIVRILLCKLLMLCLLLLLKLLVFLVLLCNQLGLLLLILLIEFGVSGVRWWRCLVGLQLACMRSIGGMRCSRGTIGLGVIGCSCLVSSNDTLSAKL